MKHFALCINITAYFREKHTHPLQQSLVYIASETITHIMWSGEVTRD